MRMIGRTKPPNEALSSFRRLVKDASYASESAAGPSNYAVASRIQERSLQQATAKVMREYVRNHQPMRSIAFASAALKLPFFGVAEGRRIPSISFDLPPDMPAIKSTTLHYRILLESASVLGSVNASRRVLIDLLKQNLEVDKNIFRGLSHLVFSTIDSDATRVIESVQELLPDYSHQNTVSTPAQVERRVRLATLAETLQELGFVDKTILAATYHSDLNRRYQRLNHVHTPDLCDYNMDSATEPETKPMRRVSAKDELLDWLIRDSSALFDGSMEESQSVPFGTPTPSELRRPLTSEAYAMRIRVYAVVRRDYESAQAVYAAMLNFGIRPTFKHIAPLIEGLVTVGRLDEAQRLKHNARHLSGLIPPLAIHTGLIHAYAQRGDFQAARNEIQELINNGHPPDDSITYLDTAQRPDAHLSPVSSDQPTATELQKPLTPDAYAMRIRVYAVVLRDYDSAQSVYAAMLTQGIQPRLKHIAPLIEGLVAVGRLDEAQRLKQNARYMVGLKPTLALHTSFIGAFVQKGDFSAARTEIQELIDSGYQVDDRIANMIEAAHIDRYDHSLINLPVKPTEVHNVTTRFQALMQTKNYLAAQNFVLDALKSGLVPDKVMHDLVRNGAFYVQKQHDKLQLELAEYEERNSARLSSPSSQGDAIEDLDLAPSSRAMPLNVEEGRARLEELALAVRISRNLKGRIPNMIRKATVVRRKRMKEYRKKVVQLILDFADGRLHQDARRALLKETEQKTSK